MEHIKMKKHVLKKAGGFLLLTAVILAGSTWERRTAGDRQPQFYAWWGTIYPEFCFEKAEDNGENKPVKISFWACASPGLVIQYFNGPITFD